MTICVKTKVMNKKGAGAHWVCHGTVAGNGEVIERFPFTSDNRNDELKRAASFATGYARATGEMGSMF